MQRHHDETNDADIAPTEGRDYGELELPETIARQAQALAGADEPPRTLGELSRLFAQTKAFQAGADGDVEDMLVTDESRHAVHAGEDTVNTYCFLDALGIGLLQEDPVRVTTRPPGLDETIELTVSSEGISGSSPEMVVAYGFSTGLPTDAAELERMDPEETLAAMHEHGCPTQNLFPTEEAYEVWTSQADAATVPIGLPQALAMVADYVEDWSLDKADPVTDEIDIRPEDGEGYAERELPGGISDRLRAVTGLAGVEREPRTLGDFAELNGSAEAFSPEGTGIEAMLIADDSRHRVQLDDGEAHTNCILDALILGFLEEEPVEITTNPPGLEETIELTVSERGIQGGHEDMVVSFGFSHELPTERSAFQEMDNEEALAVAHELGCPKINLFPDRDAYDAWAADADAITMPLGVAEALALARDTVEQWADATAIESQADDGNPQRSADPGW